MVISGTLYHAFMLLIKLPQIGKAVFGSLSGGACSEVDRAVFATYPSTNNKFRAYSHEPSIRRIVRRSGLSSQSVSVVGRY